MYITGLPRLTLKRRCFSNARHSLIFPAGQRPHATVRGKKPFNLGVLKNLDILACRHQTVVPVSSGADRIERSSARRQSHDDMRLVGAATRVSSPS